MAGPGVTDNTPIEKLPYHFKVIEHPDLGILYLDNSICEFILNLRFFFKAHILQAISL